MNTPKPCDTCNNLWYDCLRKDDPSDSAECKLKLEMGNSECHKYEKYSEGEIKC